MTLTLLLDLDDTLLHNQIEFFLNPYLKGLSGYMTSAVTPDRMVPVLLSATQLMIENQHPGHTLEEIFDAGFYPVLEIQKEKVRGQIEAFYAEGFPTLHNLTSPVPGAVEMVRQALARGYRVVVATNPLFPRTAIDQRLSWAELDPSRTPFNLVTCYEEFHFAKPNPAFFAEVLAQLGWPWGPAVMVGNDLENDIIPARKAGLYTYLVTPAGTSTRVPECPHGEGSLDLLLPWLEKLDACVLPAEPTTPEALLAVLQASPAALDALARHLPADLWNYRPAPTEWSLTEIVCHLRDVTREVDLPRLMRVSSEENPFIPGMVTDPWAVERGYAQQNGPEALRDFIETRYQVTELLRSLDPVGWERSARHAIFGPTTLRELVGFTATHDRSHLQQVEQLLRPAGQDERKIT